MYNGRDDHVNQFIADEMTIYNLMKSLDGTVDYSAEERDLIDKALKLHLLDNARRIIASYQKDSSQKKHILK